LSPRSLILQSATGSERLGECEDPFKLGADVKGEGLAASRVNLDLACARFLISFVWRLETSLFAEFLEPVCVAPVCYSGTRRDNPRMLRFPPPEDQSVVDADPLQKKKAPPTMMREAGPCTNLDSATSAKTAKREVVPKD
jgi:hypothetical protein